jgi:hypothetical protein
LKVTAIFASKRRKPAPDKVFTPPPQLIHRQSIKYFYAFCINRKRDDATNRPIFSVSREKCANIYGQNRDGCAKSTVGGIKSAKAGMFGANDGIKSTNVGINLVAVTKNMPMATQNQPSLVKTPSSPTFFTSATELFRERFFMFSKIFIYKI